MCAAVQLPWNWETLRVILVIANHSQVHLRGQARCGLEQTKNFQASVKAQWDTVKNLKSEAGKHRTLPQLLAAGYSD